MKKVIRKIAAVGVGVAMLGATMAGSLALAYDLGDFPEPFVANEKFVNTALVAASGDADARSDVNTYMGTMVAEETGGDVTVTGGKTKDDVPLETGFNGSFGQIDDSDISSLQDSKISYRDTSYNIREIINFTGETYIGVSGEDGEFEFADKPYVKSANKGINYYYYMDDPINITNNAPNTSYSFAITFMGKELEITGLACAANLATVTVQMSSEVGVREGDTVSCEGDTVEVTGIYSSSVGIQVGTKEKFISSGSSYDFGACSVKVESIGYNSNDPTLSRAIISTGEKISDTVTDGKAFELFTNYEPDGDAPWKWRATCNSATDSWSAIGAYLADDIDDITDTDTEPDPWTVGEAYAFPNNFAAISFDSLNVDDEDYETVELTTSENCDMNDTTYYKDATCVIFQATDDILEIGGENVNKIWALEYNKSEWNETWDLWYEDSDGSETDSTYDAFNIKYDDTTMFVNHSLQLTNVLILIGDDADIPSAAEDIVINMSDGFEDFGESASYESGVIELNLTHENDISGRDYDVMTPYGVIIETPETHLDNDKIVLKIPPKQVKAKITVSAEVTTAGTGSGASAELVTADEVTTKEDWNLILVGGPCVNSLAADFLGLTFPACGADATGFGEDEAMISLYDNGDKVAMVVAGWTADDTKRAAKVLANPSSFADELDGKTSVTVTGTGLTVDSITVA